MQQDRLSQDLDVPGADNLDTLMEKVAGIHHDHEAIHLGTPEKISPQQVGAGCDSLTDRE